MLSLETARARARLGAAFLDRRLPGWRKDVDSDRLDMARGFTYHGSCGCVLAQIDQGSRGEATEGYYSRGADRVGISADGRTVVSLGFLLRRPGGGIPPAEDYAALTDAWREVLAAP